MNYLAVCFIETATQIRAGQVLILIGALGLDRQHPMLLGKAVTHLRKHRILSGGMIRPEAKHGQGLVPCTGSAAAQPGRGFRLQLCKSLFVFRILRQIQLPQIQCRHIRHKISIMIATVHPLRSGICGFIIAALDHRLLLCQNLRHQSGKFFFIHIDPPIQNSRLEPSPIFFVGLPFSKKPMVSSHT